MTQTDDLTPPLVYGVGDTSFRAAGGEPGLRALVEDFYACMDARLFARTIRAMHPVDLTLAKDKLCLFLCGWLNGPKRYQAKYGEISIPGTHAHLAIGTAERDAWLACMREALSAQPYEPAFRDYLLTALAKPAARVCNCP